MDEDEDEEDGDNNNNNEEEKMFVVAKKPLGGDSGGNSREKISVLLSASVKRFGVSRMRDFFCTPQEVVGCTVFRILTLLMFLNQTC